MEDLAAFAVANVVSEIFTQVLARNDKLPFDEENDLTIFHAQNPPEVSIKSYLERIARYSPCSPDCFILGLVYIDRITQTSAKQRITSRNVHRLLITSIMLAAKYNEDFSFPNSYYARVGGISVGELNSLEVEFLFLLNFSLNVEESVFERYRSTLIKRAPYIKLDAEAMSRPNLVVCHRRSPSDESDCEYEEPTDYSRCRTQSIKQDETVSRFVHQPGIKCGGDERKDD